MGYTLDNLQSSPIGETPPCMYGVNCIVIREGTTVPDTPLHVWGKPLPLECKPYNGTAWGFDYELIAF